MKKTKRIITLSIVCLFCFSHLAFAGGPAGGNPFYDIRIYCEYHDKEKGKNITFKLLKEDGETVKITNSMFIRHIDNVRYTVGEPTYSKLVNDCKKEISEKFKDKGEFVGLKGTNAKMYESLSWYYPVLRT